MTEKEKLLNQWISLKEIEDTVKKKRDALSEEIEKLYPLEDGKKSHTFKEENFDIEIKKNERAQIDQKEADHLAKSFALNILPFRIKYELDSKKYSALKEMEPAFYKRCSEAVTFIPGKSSVKVSLKGEK